MKSLFQNIILFICLICLCSCDHHAQNGIRIGIVVPLEHTAMHEIVAGFSETLKSRYHQPVEIKVQNAENDANLQRSIIQQMRDEHYALIVPIGTSASQMTLAMVRNQPVISLAADISEKERQQLHPCNTAVVHDEIPPEKLIAFIHAVYPQLTQITLIHSAEDKVFPDVNATLLAGKKQGITVNNLMVTSLPELYNAANSIPANTQAIFVLKDNLIVSGIPTLAKLAAGRHIPLITSDQGSVEAGAAFSLGVHEREIGVEGANLAAIILQGKPACEIPIAEMKNLSVFVNPNALQQEQQTLDNIKKAATQLGYHIEMSAATAGK